MGETLKKLALSRAGADALGIGFLVALCAAVLGLFAEAGLVFGVAHGVVVAISIAIAFPLGVDMAHGLREGLPSSGRRVPKTRKALAVSLALRCALVLACIVALSVIVGAFAVVMQVMLVPAFGLGAAMAVVRVLALLLAMAIAPLPALLFFGLVRSRSGLFRPARDVAAVKGAYLPVLLSTLVTVGFGIALFVLCSLVPWAWLGYALYAVIAAPIGAGWAIFSAALCLYPERMVADDGRTWRLPPVPPALSRRFSQGTACLLAAVLAFSLMPADSLAFAVEGAPVAIEAEPPGPIEQPAGGNIASEEPQPSEPKAQDPIDYYEQPEAPEGDLVYADEGMAVFRTSEREYQTVIGGVALTYADERGHPRLIDNTLVPEREGLFFGDAVYVNAENAYRAELPASMDEQRGIILEKDGHSLEMLPAGGDFTRSAAKGAALRYTEVSDGIDYQYTLLGNLVKEDIILNKQVPRQPFRTIVRPSEGLSLTLENGLVVARADAANSEGGESHGIFGDVAEEEGMGEHPALQEAGAEDVSGDRDDVVFELAAPMAIDASGAVDDGLELTLAGEDDGSYIIGIEADWDWLEAPERAYPVRIDPTTTIKGSTMRVMGVEFNWPDKIIGENGFAYAGYDDGDATGTGEYNGGVGHGICRVYAAIDYNFRYIMSEARINSATFSIYQGREYSGGKTKFGLYRNASSWDPDNLTWNSQTGVKHELVQYQYALKSRGYMNWDVREVVNNWVQGVYAQRGFCIKAENERYMQCELFEDRYSDHPPRLTINWAVPDPVSDAWPLNGTTVNLRPVTEHDADNKLRFDGVFADGVATPRSFVSYSLDGKDDEAGVAYASRSYKYPDSTSWQDQIPEGTRYKDKLSNWQTHLFVGLEFDKLYKVLATPRLEDSVGAQKASDEFLVYKASAKDTLPYIASHYGVSVDVLAKDNRVQDSLVVGNNTLFVRNPKTTKAYNPANLSTDQKKRIDSALMGRGKHCEYGFEPINLNTGNFVLEAVDATVPELEDDFALARTYNAKNEGYQSVFGRNWAFAWAESLSLLEDGTIAYMTGDGKTLYFAPDGEGGYASPVGFHLDLRRIPYKASELPGAQPWTAEEEEPTLYRYELYEPDGSYRSFNAWGLLTAVRSARGLVTDVGYDESGRLASVTSPTGVAYRFALDDQGRISAIELPDGNVLRYGYDADDNLTSYTDATGATISYVYDERHRMLEWRDGNGKRIIANQYDDDDRVICQTDAAGGRSFLEYADGQTRTTDAIGHVTTYSYDDQMRTVGIAYPDGYEVARSYDGDGNLIADEDGSYSYDAHGNLQSATTLDGARTTYAYDEQMRLVEVVEPDGTVVSSSYDDAGNLAWRSSTAGDADTFTYDSLGRCLSRTDADGVTESYGWEGALRIRVTDGLGHTTAYAYDAMGRQVSATDPLGRTSRTMYDAAGRVVGEQDGSGAYTSYALDAAGLLTSMTDARGFTTSFAYDEAYNIASMTNAEGGVTRWEHDALGNQVLEVDPDGVTSQRSYDSRGRLASEADAAGGTTTYSYDGRGRLIGAVNPLGGAEGAAYEGTLGVPESYTDALGNQSTYAYDIQGNLIEAVWPDGSGQQAAYGPGSRLASFTDEAGLSTTYRYSRAGRLEALDRGGRVYAFEYDGAGNAVAVTDALGRTTHLSYDDAGQIVEIEAPDGTVTVISYDGAGRPAVVTDPLGHANVTEYDGLGNVISQTDALGGITTYAYDALGNLTSTTDAAGSVSSYAYTPGGRVREQVDALGNARAAAYDSAGRLASSTDALGRTLSFSYDSAGNLTELALPDGSTERYAYDANNNLVRSEDALGLVLEMAYDVRGNLASVKASTGAQETYGYDGAGNLVSQTDALGRRAFFEYDPFGNLVRETGFDGAVTSYEHDAADQLVRLVDALGNATDYGYDLAGNQVSETAPGEAVTSRSYDGAHRLLSETDPVGNVTTWSYDAAGNAVEEVDPDGYAKAYAYDALGRMTRSTDGRGHGTSYAYDAVGRLVSVTHPEGGTEEYLYDAEGQLIAAADANGATEAYGYDLLGNLIERIDPLGAVTRYSYDAHGCVTSETDPLGRTTAYEVALDGTVTSKTSPDGATWSYGYDLLGRLTSATTPRGYVQRFEYGLGDEVGRVSDSLGAVQSFAYDARGQMTRSVNALGAASSYAYDARGNLIAEVDGMGARTAYAYDAADRLVGLTDAVGARLTIGYDGRGNVTSLHQEEVIERYAYDGAGNLASYVDGTDAKTTYGYDGDGRLTSTTDTLGHVASWTYDKAGNVTQATDARGYATLYAYDAIGNLVSTTDRNGAVESRTYDAAGQLSSVADAEGHITSYAYDQAGNLAKVTDALGRITSYGYDVEGNLTSIESPSGQVERMEYDLASRLAEVRDPAGSSSRYDYDVLGDLVEKSYSMDARAGARYSFDGEGRAIARNDAAGDASFAYDGLGRLVSETDGQGRTLAYSYDDRGNLALIEYPDGSKVRYSYDAAGNPTIVEAPEGSYRYSYDALGRPVRLERPNGTATAFSYDAEGNVTLVETADQEGLVSRYAYAYDGEGNIASEASEVVGDDGDLHRVSRSFAYDAADRLVSCEQAGSEGAFSERYAYDAAGNRIALDRVGDRAESISYAYDADDRLVRSVSDVEGVVEYAYDASGQLVSKRAEGEEEMAYAYGVEGRLEAVRQGGRLLMAAAYDGDGNRVMQASRFTGTAVASEGAKEGADDEDANAEEEGSPASLSRQPLLAISLFPYGATAMAATALAACCPSSMAGALDGACRAIEGCWRTPAGTSASFEGFALGALEDIGASPSELRAAAEGLLQSSRSLSFPAEGLDVVTYVNSTVSGISQVMASEGTASSASRHTYGLARLASQDASGARFYVPDGRGSAVQELTDSGRVASWQAFSPFGDRMAGSMPGELPSFGFNSEEHHPQTGLQYLRARYYEPETASFGVRDTYLGSIDEPLSLNRYLYCLANPVKYIDPTGHIPKSRQYKRYTPPRSNNRTLINRLGSSSSVAARYEKQGARNQQRVVPGGDLYNSWLGATVANHLNKAYNAYQSGNMARYNYGMRCAEAARKRLLAFCNGDMELAQSYIEKGMQNRLALHTLLDIGGVFFFLFDALNAGVYDSEGDEANAIFSGIGAIPFVGSGATVVKYGNKAARIVNGAEAATDLAKYYRHKSPGKLEQNMIKEGLETPPYKYNAHHIVAQGDRRAESARKTLERFGIDINDAANGVFLRTDKEVAEGAYHPGLHTDEYYNEVNRRLNDATSKEQALSALDLIKAELQNNAFKH